jgi:Ankyrin repeats (3 copies)
MQLVGVLLHAGACCNVQNLKGQTPLHLAVLARSSSILLQMIKYGAKKGKPQPLQVDISAQDAMGCSALHVAAYVGHTDSCRVLLQYGANSLQLDYGGKHTHESVPYNIAKPCQMQQYRVPSLVPDYSWVLGKFTKGKVKVQRRSLQPCFELLVCLFTI